MTAPARRAIDANPVIDLLKQRFGERLSTAAAVREQHGKDESYISRLTSPMRKSGFSGRSCAAWAALAISFTYPRLISPRVNPPRPAVQGPSSSQASIQAMLATRALLLTPVLLAATLFAMARRALFVIEPFVSIAVAAFPLFQALRKADRTPGKIEGRS